MYVLSTTDYKCGLFSESKMAKWDHLMKRNCVTRFNITDVYPESFPLIHASMHVFIESKLKENIYVEQYPCSLWLKILKCWCKNKLEMWITGTLFTVSAYLLRYMVVVIVSCLLLALIMKEKKKAYPFVL